MICWLKLGKGSTDVNKPRVEEAFREDAVREHLRAAKTQKLANLIEIKIYTEIQIILQRKFVVFIVIYFYSYLFMNSYRHNPHHSFALTWVNFLISRSVQIQLSHLKIIISSNLSAFVAYPDAEWLKNFLADSTVVALSRQDCWEYWCWSYSECTVSYWLSRSEVVPKNYDTIWLTSWKAGASQYLHM